MSISHNRERVARIARAALVFMIVFGFVVGAFAQVEAALKLGAV